MDFAPAPEQTPGVPEFQSLDSPPLDLGNDPGLATSEEGGSAVVAQGSPSLTVSDWLCRTSLFRPRASLPQSTTTDLPQRAQVAVPTLVVWGLLGLLLTVQVDWLASEALQRRQRAIAPLPLPWRLSPRRRIWRLSMISISRSCRRRRSCPRRRSNRTGFTAAPNQPQVVAARGGGSPPDS